MLRVALAQIDPVVGAFESNVQKIKEALDRACAERARLLLTPELGICGYPPYDLVDRPEMIERNEKALQDLLLFTRDKSCALVVGHIAASSQPYGRKSQNQVSVLEKGQKIFEQAKTLLPTYDVFDEGRYFEPARTCAPFHWEGISIGVAICEDLWGSFQIQGRPLYEKDFAARMRGQTLDLVLSISSSPFENRKYGVRERIHQEFAKAQRLPLIYVNQVGATDEILFDGGSFACDSKGELIGRLPFFESSFGIIEVPSGSEKGQLRQASETFQNKSLDEMEVLTQGLVLGIREYFKRTGFKKALIGLSGGIDSAVVAVLATLALGKSHVLGVGMPSQYSSSHSLEDAEQLAQRLGIRFEVRPIKFLNATAVRELSETRGQLNSIALENLQARLRALTLMTFSNHDSALVLTTGNKSELAMGYCTLYGDMAGALNPVGDLYKTQIYALARYLNQRYSEVIPQRTLTKAPSAELRPNQTDQDSLPPYQILDEFLEAYLEQNLSVSDLCDRFENQGGQPEGWVKGLIRMIGVNEYKRRQAAPILKVSKKAFGIGRRIPIAKLWNP